MYGAKEEETMHLTKETNSLTIENKEPPTREEIVRLFKIIKSPRENGTTAEILRARKEKLKKCIHRIVQKICQEEMLKPELLVLQKENIFSIFPFPLQNSYIIINNQEVFE